MLGFVASSCFFTIEREIAPNFVKKLTVPSFADLSQPNCATHENGKVFFRKSDKNYASLPLTLSEEEWRTRLTSFSSERRYRFTIVRQMTPRVLSGRTAAMEIEIIMERPSSFVIFCLITFSAAPLARANKTVISSRSNCARLMSSVG